MNEDLFSEILDWDSEISNDSTFVLLPEGEYPFTVVNLEKGFHNGSAKLTKCPKAILTIEVRGEEGKATITHNLFLHRKCEGLLCEFFTAIGARQHGETLRMDWSKVKGATGMCKVGIHEWTGKDGSQKQSNEIKKFLEPATPTQQASGFTPGKF